MHQSADCHRSIICISQQGTKKDRNGAIARYLYAQNDNISLIERAGRQVSKCYGGKEKRETPITRKKRSSHLQGIASACEVSGRKVALMKRLLILGLRPDLISNLGASMTCLCKEQSVGAARSFFPLFSTTFLHGVNILVLVLFFSQHVRCVALLGFPCLS